MIDQILIGDISIFTQNTMSTDTAVKDAAFTITSEGTVFIYPEWRYYEAPGNRIKVSLEKVSVYPKPLRVSYSAHSIPESATFSIHL